MSTLLKISLLACCVFVCAGWPLFQDRIPNGHNVPSPCNSSIIADGVGHKNLSGRGTRNPFGYAFEANGYKWTETLCRADSDGDGKTNGQELGDPDCVWSEGKTPTRTTGITHPGVCTPLEDTLCRIKNEWNLCPRPFSCKGFSEPEVITKKLTMTKSLIPNKEIAYMCQALDMQVDDKIVHFVGSVPIIDKKEYVDRMTLYECPVTVKPTNRQPIDCEMTSLECNKILDVWGKGSGGTCLHPSEGIVIDGTYKQKITVVLQIRWNNPRLVENVTDSSGFQVYLTPNLRLNNARIARYGQTKLQLPPKQSLISRTHTCPKKCKKVSSTKYITSAVFQMHKYGIKGRVSLLRDGKLVKDLIPMHDYDYNLPPLVVEFDSPIEYLPGDEIKTECYFNTQKVDNYVYFGGRIMDEMCFTYFRFFPDNYKNPDCLGYGDLNLCMMKPALLPEYNVKGCQIAELWTSNIINRNTQIIQACKPARNMFCDPSCKALIPVLYKNEPCIDPSKARLEVNYILSRDWFIYDPLPETRWNNLNFINLIKTCEDALRNESYKNMTKPDCVAPKQSTHKEENSTAVIIVLIFLVIVLALVAIVLAVVLVIKIRDATCYILIKRMKTYKLHRTSCYAEK